MLVSVVVCNKGHGNFQQAHDVIAKAFTRACGSAPLSIGNHQRSYDSHALAVQDVRFHRTTVPRKQPTSTGLRHLLPSGSQRYRPGKSGDHSLYRAPCRSSVPRERIDGTQMPTKSPWSRIPPNHSPMESRKDKPAAARIRALALRMASELALPDCAEGGAGERSSSMGFIRFSIGGSDSCSHLTRLRMQ